MADDITIVVGVQDKGILTAIDKTNRLESTVRKLSKALERGKIDGDQFNAALEKKAKSAKSYGDQVKAYADKLTVAKKAQEQAAAAERQAKVEAQQFAKARREATEANRQFDIEQKKATIATQQAAAEEEHLKNKFVEGYAAMNLYSKELNELAMARKANIITTEQQTAAVARLNNEMQTGTGRFSGYGLAAQMATKGNRQLGVVTQQAGYQVGDFLVQVQSGTNWMVAFGQQATQLVGVLPLMGAGFMGLSMGGLIALSAGLGIAIPLVTAFGAAFFRSRESADEASEKIRTTAEVLKDLKTATKEASVELRVLQGSFRDALQVESIDEIELVKRRINEVATALTNASRATGLRAAGQGAMADRIKALGEEKEALGITLERLEANKKLLEVEESYRELMGEIKESTEEAQSSHRDRIRDLTIQNNLLRIQREYGEDSIRESDYRIQLERERLQSLKSQGLISQEQLENEIKLVVEGENLRRGLTDSESKASALADALKDAASAMSSLSSFGDGLDKALAVSVARVQALKTGINAEVAGQIAGKRADLSARVQQGLASGVPIGTLMAEIDSSSAKISDLEKSRLEEKALEEAAREAKKAGSKDDPLGKLIEEQRQRKILLGLTGEQRVLQEAIFQVTSKLGDAAKTTGNAQIEALAKENLMLEQQERLYEEKMNQQKEIAGVLQSSMETAFMSMVDGTKSVKDAFKAMASDIIKELYRIFVVKKITGMIANAIVPGSVVPSANGNIFSGGNVIPFANGGVVGSPTYFPMSGGQTGLMGEAGPEAIMPLKRGANGKLGVEVQGGSGTVNIVQNFNISANGDESVKRIVQQQIPRIAEATKAAVVDSKRRGGSYGRAFS
jgi:hypothetical protein